MRSRVTLTESFTTPYPWRWVAQNDAGGEYRAAFMFDVDGTTQFYDLLLADWSGDAGDTWYVVFGPETEDDHEEARTAVRMWGNQTVATRILATVADILRRFLTLKPAVTTLVLDSAEASRTKLYRRMATRLLPGWTVDTSPTESGQQMILRAPK